MAVQRVRVGDVLSLHRNPVPIDETESYRQIGLYSWGKGFIHRPPCLGLELSNLRYFQVPAGALVLSNIQAWEAALAVSTDVETEFIGSNRFLSYVPRTSDVDVRYLLHYFLSEPGLHQIRQASPGTQVRNRTLGQQLFERLEIPLPDVREQQRIAARLDGVASMTARLDQTRVPLARVKARILARTEISTCPSRPLKDLLKSARSPIEVKPDESYRSLGVRSFGKGLIRYPATKGVDLSKLRYFSVRPSRLVVSNIKAWEGAVAMTGDGDEGLVASSRFLQWEAADPAAIDLQYLRLFFATPMGLSLLGRASPGSADRNRTLSSQRFLDIAVPLPPLDQQRRLVDLAAQIEAIEAQLEQRDAISSAVLPAARNEAFAELI
ncbi:restriction endonuclease subunit S [Nocardioides daejeonensis]|uniref:restriction endonuclease subunit S n=1 Tax=Nocardioides daejeonensis TaxID=1046556 RepID=UPI000D7478F9|nr:restriction endonuclease subunit S [Nocardioides daejeonensis]